MTDILVHGAKILTVKSKGHVDTKMMDCIRMALKASRLSILTNEGSQITLAESLREGQLRT